MPSRYYEFGPFRLDAGARLLSRGEQTVPLPPKVAETLLVLVQKAGEVVAKQELLDRVWPDTFIEEGSLARTISVLRKTLADAADGQEFIATLSKRGYRFTAKVTACEEGAATPAGKIMLVVLPFDDLSGEKGEEYFNDGLTEEMITQLSRLNPERLGVIARTSSMRYKGTHKGIREIGAELGVGFVLEGSVRRAGERVRIAAQLIQVSDETHVWAESYERDLGDILKLQSEVARAIARQIQVKLTPREERRLAAAQSVAPEAYEAYLKGRHLWNKRTEDGMRRSIALYEEALRSCPDYAAAYSGIADSYVMLACRGIAPAKETFLKAKVAARRAIAIDDELGEAHGSLAHVRLHDWDWEGLERDFERAIALNPANAIVYYWYAEFLMTRDRPADAIAMAERAHRLDPLSPVIGASLSMIYYLARQFERSEDIAEKTRDLNPDHFLPRLRLGLVRIQQRRFDLAIPEVELAVRLSGGSTEAQSELAAAYFAAGRTRDAFALLNELEKPGGRYVLPYNIAKVYALANDRDQAFAWLEKSYEQGIADLIELNSEPMFDNIRSDPRFTDLMRRVGWSV